MAVTSVTILSKRAWQDTTASYRVWVYQVLLDAPPSDPADLLVATDGVTSIPAINSLYAGSTTIRCRKVGEATQDENSQLRWEVPVEWNNAQQGTTIEEDPNPLARPADISWTWDSVSRPVEQDLNGNPIANSAGEIFDPPLIQEDCRLVCNIERNVATHSPADALAKMNTTNLNAITIAGVTLGEKQGLLREYSASLTAEAGIAFYRQRFAIVMAPSHDREVLDIGYNYLDGGELVPFKDKNGDRPPLPQKLNGSGTESTSPHYLVFTTRESTNWSSLNLPTNADGT